MIEMNENDDPMLFSVGIPTGRLIVQYMEVAATMQALVSQGETPNNQHIVRAIREASRTPEVAKIATDAMLIAAWQRIHTRVATAGNA
jgi:hypothetical protein